MGWREEGGVMGWPKLTREQFIALYCARSGVAWDELAELNEAVPCDCGEESCQGWAMESRFRPDLTRPPTPLR